MQDVPKALTTVAKPAVNMQLSEINMLRVSEEHRSHITAPLIYFWSGSNAESPCRRLHLSQTNTVARLILIRGSEPCHTDTSERRQNGVIVAHAGGPLTHTLELQKAPVITSESEIIQAARYRLLFFPVPGQSQLLKFINRER